MSYSSHDGGRPLPPAVAVPIGNTLSWPASFRWCLSANWGILPRRVNCCDLWKFIFASDLVCNFHSTTAPVIDSTNNGGRPAPAPWQLLLLIYHRSHMHIDWNGGVLEYSSSSPRQLPLNPPKRCYWRYPGEEELLFRNLRKIMW